MSIVTRIGTFTVAFQGDSVYFACADAQPLKRIYKLLVSIDRKTHIVSINSESGELTKAAKATVMNVVNRHFMPYLDHLYAVKGKIDRAITEAETLINQTAEYSKDTYQAAIDRLLIASGMAEAVDYPVVITPLVNALRTKIAQTGKYNGWKNYESWCVALWIDNDRLLYNKMRNIANKLSDVYAHANFIKAFIEDSSPLAGSADVYTDLLNAALAEVDWREVAEHYREEGE